MVAGRGPPTTCRSILYRQHTGASASVVFYAPCVVFLHSSPAPTMGEPIAPTVHLPISPCQVHSTTTVWIGPSVRATCPRLFMGISVAHGHRQRTSKCLPTYAPALCAHSAVLCPAHGTAHCPARVVPRCKPPRVCDAAPPPRLLFPSLGARRNAHSVPAERPTPEQDSRRRRARAPRPALPPDVPNARQSPLCSSLLASVP